MSYDPIDGPCAECKSDEVCCDHRGRALCQDCWHAARYREMPYVVVRDADGYVVGSANRFGASTRLKEEAEAAAAEMTEEEARVFALYQKDATDPASDESARAHWAGVVAHAEAIGIGWRTYSAKPAECWYGDRIAHPGYMERRRAGIVAAHPEYADKDTEG